MNKKGIFMSVFAIVIFAILTYAFYALVVKSNETQQITIGDTQIALLNTYQDAEKDLLYLENLVKYTTYNTINEFNNNAGVKQECNKVWKFDSDCEPKLEENFINSFKTKIKGYEIKEAKIQDNFLIVKFNLNYNKKHKNFEINYNLEPEIKQELAIDFNKLNNIKAKIRECVDAKKELTSCVNEKSSISNDIISFTIENNKNILVLTDKLEFKKSEFKFSINQKDTGIITRAF